MTTWVVRSASNSSMSCPPSLKSEVVDRIRACQRMARAARWPIASMRPSRRSARPGRRSGRTPRPENRIHRCVGASVAWGIGVVTKGNEYVANALESDASPRVQKCLDRAEYCERAASILTSPNAIATFLRSARSWREMAEQYRLMATVGRIHQLCRGPGYGDRDETGDRGIQDRRTMETGATRC